LSKRELRFGVLGVGRIGKIHIENLANRIPEADAVALSDVIPEEPAAVSAKFDIPQAFPDYQQALDLPDVDAVAVCTPTNSDAQMVLDAAARDKHIFCEKPIELSNERIAAINSAVEKAGVSLMVGFNGRFEVFGSEGMVTVKNNIPDSHISFDRSGPDSSPELTHKDTRRRVRN